MTTYSMRSRASLGALMVCCALLPQLTACSLYNGIFHRGPKDAGCTEKPFVLNTDVRPPLKVPDGLSAPDTRNAVKVPELAAPERARARSEPCLSRPPSYFDKGLAPYVPPAPPPRPKRWWQFWRKAPPPPSAAAPAAPATEPDVSPAPVVPATPPSVTPESK